MTKQKHLKQRIRARMAQTGERYTTARRHIVGASAVSASDTVTPCTGPTALSGHPPGDDRAAYPAGECGRAGAPHRRVFH